MDFKSNMKAYIAEAIGTAVLVLVGCGTAVATSTLLVKDFNISTALAFGLAVVAMAYCIGRISGCHINPAISLGMFIDGRMKKEDFIMYVVFQFIGGIIGAGLLALILSQTGAVDGFKDVATVYGLGCNGYGDGTAAELTAFGAILIEALLTFVFVMAALGVTSTKATAAQGGIVIGLALVLVHLMGIAFTGTSVNPARSFGPALFMAILGESDPIGQVWVFIIAPLIGAALAGFCWKFLKPAGDE